MAQKAPNSRNAGMGRYITFALFTCIGLVIGWTIRNFTSRPSTSAPIVISTPFPTETPFPTATSAPLRVHVSGAVVQPAVYRLAPGSIVQDAIEAAGGPTDQADLDAVNLAVELQDQQKVHIPRQGESDSPPVISGGNSSNGEDDEEAGLVNINTASAAELETLPRVGPEMAKRIINYRETNSPFQSIEDIQKVTGIGPSTFEELQDLITVGDD